MVDIQVSRTTTLSPKQFIDALTDFSPRRLTNFANLDEKYYEVHDVSETSADVTEGSAFAGGVWERAHYDWSQPNVVRLTIVESNTFAPDSFWEYKVSPTNSTGSTVELTVHRVPQSVKGRLLAIPLGLMGRKIFGDDLAKTLDHLAKASS